MEDKQHKEEIKMLIGYYYRLNDTAITLLVHCNSNAWDIHVGIVGLHTSAFKVPGKSEKLRENSI